MSRGGINIVKTLHYANVLWFLLVTVLVNWMMFYGDVRVS